MNKGKEHKTNTHQAGGCTEPTEPTQPSRNRSLASSRRTVGARRCYKPGKVQSPQTAGHAQLLRETHRKRRPTRKVRWRTDAG